MQKFCDLDLGRLKVIQGHLILRSQVMVPVYSPRVISYSTYIDPIIVSVTSFEIYDV